MNSEKTSDTEQEKLPLSKKATFFRFFILVSVMLVAGLSIPFGYRLMTTSDVFRIQAIKVKGVDSDLLQKEISLYAKPLLGKAIYGISLKDVSKAVQEHPFVQSAEVWRQPPNTLNVRVILREPIATIKLEKTYLVDQHGEPFLASAISPSLELPKLSGFSTNVPKDHKELSVEIGKAVETLNNHRKAGSPGGRLLELQYEEITGMIAQFENGLELVLGESGTSEKWMQFKQILDHVDESKKRLVYVNIASDKNKNRAIVRFSNISG